MQAIKEAWQPRHVITLVMLIGAFVLRALGINSITEYIIIAIAVSYLGLDLRTTIKSFKPTQHF